MACFRCNTTEDFIFSFKYRQQKVDLNTISYLHKNTHLRKDATFLRFVFFYGKLKKYDTSVKQKHTKTNENMFFSALFTKFCKSKIISFMQWLITKKESNENAKAEYICREKFENNI